MDRKITLLMALASGTSVANLYYCQPLLTRMGRTFGVGHAAGYIPTFTLVGLILGMLAFVPLGDMFERRRLITMACVCSAVAAAAVASSPNFTWLAVASLMVGTAAIVQHLILPLAAQLTPVHERGKTIGIVLSGMLLGALLARTVSGFVGAAMGWRTMYWIASGLMLLIAACIWFVFPESAPSEAISYPELLRSLIKIVREESNLREASLIGALLFGALNAFWVNLIFFLETPPYHYGARAAGLFGLVGAISAAGVAVIGRQVDRRGTRFGLGLGLITSLVAFVVLWLLGHELWALIAGVVFLDAGVQAGQVSNQTRIYSLVPGALSRANTIYMTTFFGGGALGAALGAYGWDGMQWDGVCLVGITMLVIALAIHFSGNQPLMTEPGKEKERELCRA